MISLHETPFSCIALYSVYGLVAYILAPSIKVCYQGSQIRSVIPIIVRYLLHWLNSQGNIRTIWPLTKDTPTMNSLS